jgi:Zn-dependent oligopeptidase
MPAPRRNPVLALIGEINSRVDRDTDTLLKEAAYHLCALNDEVASLRELKRVPAIPWIHELLSHIVQLQQVISCIQADPSYGRLQEETLSKVDAYYKQLERKRP